MTGFRGDFNLYYNVGETLQLTTVATSEEVENHGNSSVIGNVDGSYVPGRIHCEAVTARQRHSQLSCSSSTNSRIFSRTSLPRYCVLSCMFTFFHRRFVGTHAVGPPADFSPRSL